MNFFLLVLMIFSTADLSAVKQLVQIKAKKSVTFNEDKPLDNENVSQPTANDIAQAASVLVNFSWYAQRDLGQEAQYAYSLSPSEMLCLLQVQDPVNCRVAKR